MYVVEKQTILMIATTGHLISQPTADSFLLRGSLMD